MSLTDLLRLIRKGQPQLSPEAILSRASQLSTLSDAELKQRRPGPDVAETFALVTEVARRTLGLNLFPVQVRGALALQRGEIAEMQTGEGKTLAAVPAIVWFALQGKGVHVLTANDYLAKRDAEWMGPIYEWFALTCGFIGQSCNREQRKAAYACDITYATANEVGFDYLRDAMVLHPDELTGLRFAYAVIDEADSILLDEARIPLVIAGGAGSDLQLAEQGGRVVRQLRPGLHFIREDFDRNVRLTDAGIAHVEYSFRCGNLFGERNLSILTAVQDALHAEVLLRRDVDYVVKNDRVELVDEFKGRVAADRRWPAGLQSAIEAKERVAIHTQGRILGSITIQNLIGLYPHVSGMTGTAATQADDFWKMYRLPVTVIPPNRPVIRQDLPDTVFRTARERDLALVAEIQKVHVTGRPILVGSASVAQSERLSRLLQSAGIPHSVLNAYRDEEEASIIAQAGDVGAVTVSTNMAGRGTDILLGGNPSRNRERVVQLGGLYVIGTTRHEARRIDNQLRGRSGRQGDPGMSRFFLSFEDDLLVQFGIAENPDIDSVQRTAESESLQARELLWKYEAVLEHHRREMRSLRTEILSGGDAGLLPAERARELAQAVGRDEFESSGRRLQLAVMDDLWADYLANVTELKGGIHWVSWGGRDPLHEFLTGVDEIYADLQTGLEQEIADAFNQATVVDGKISFPATVNLERGATWTYLTTDNPFGSYEQRVFRGLGRAMRKALSK